MEDVKKQKPHIYNEYVTLINYEEKTPGVFIGREVSIGNNLYKRGVRFEDYIFAGFLAHPQVDMNR